MTLRSDLRLLLASLSIALGALAFAPSDVSAQTALPCGTVELIANLAHDQMLAELDENVAGYEYRINRRKQLRVHGVRSLSVDGCNATVVLDVTLKRRIRRDASGTVTVRGDLRVTPRSGGNVEICLADPEVTDVTLSHTLGIGESVYRAVANRVIPDSVCFTVRWPR